MPRQKRLRSKSGYYHIMLRGNEKRNIFLDDEDKLRFIETMHQKKLEDRFYIHAFCLMDNHLHLMISEGSEDIAKAIKRIAVSYVFYFNKKYKRVGHLFQDRYKSEMVEDDGYVLSLARYIHQNPVKANLVKSAGNYRWSSYNGYINDNDPLSRCLDRETVMELFSKDREKARKLFVEYMNKESEELFLDMKEEEITLDDKEAMILFNQLLNKNGIALNESSKIIVPDAIIKEFAGLSHLSIRRIAGITKMNKDRINKILRK